MVFASQSRSLYDFTIVSAWVVVTETSLSPKRCFLPWDRPIYRETSAILSASSVYLALAM